MTYKNEKEIIELKEVIELISSSINNVGYQIIEAKIIDDNFDDLEIDITVEFNNRLELFKLALEFENSEFKNVLLIERIDLIEEKVRNNKLEFDIDYWSYNITYDQLSRLFDDKKIEIPDMQRGFVWEHIQASKLIESIFMGLPLPSLFLIKESAGRYLVVDGLQRLTTIWSFRFNKNLPNYPGHSGFKLRGVNSTINNKTYDDIFRDNPEIINRFDMGTINVIEFKQNKPEFEEAMYFLFERLNSGGTTLSAQQIRNSLYYGPFNKLLNEFSNNKVSAFFSQKKKDDLFPSEVVLRIIAIYNFIVNNNLLENCIQFDKANLVNNEGVVKNIVYKNLINQTAEFYHIEYKKTENRWITKNSVTDPRELHKFQQSSEYKDILEIYEKIFCRIEEAIDYINSVFEDNSFKRVENGDYISRITPIMIESIIVSKLVSDDLDINYDIPSKIQDKFKIMIQENYSEFFKQATGKVENILGRVSTIIECFSDE